jgi:hypothetical protein
MDFFVQAGCQVIVLSMTTPLPETCPNQTPKIAQARDEKLDDAGNTVQDRVVTSQQHMKWKGG